MGCTVYARVAVVASSIHAHTSSHGPVRGGAASASGCTFISLLVVFRAPTCSRKSTPNAATVLAHDYAIIRCDLRRRKGTVGGQSAHHTHAPFTFIIRWHDTRRGGVWSRARGVGRLFREEIPPSSRSRERRVGRRVGVAFDLRRQAA